MQSNLLEKLLC